MVQPEKEIKSNKISTVHATLIDLNKMKSSKFSNTDLVLASLNNGSVNSTSYTEGIYIYSTTKLNSMPTMNLTLKP